MNSDFIFMFLCTLLVFFMTPGLAFFYGGMVRRKNTLNTIVSVISMIGIGIVMWIAFGYTLTFGKDHFGIIGDLDNVFLRNIGLTANEGNDYSEILTVVFNMMFAVISPAIIFGSLAERVKFSKMLIFSVAWTLLVYYPLAHMAWGGGLLEMIGSVDFAGGNVIHISTGVSGLVACIMTGRRKGFGAMAYQPHNIPLFILGAMILWVGWFGFNCGCAGGANNAALLAFVNTAISSAVSMITWMILEHFLIKKITVMGAVTGGIVGLVGITPGAAYVPLWSSFIIGFTSAPICYFAISKLKKKFGYDDALDAFGCHGTGGIWGGIVTGIFASTKINGSLPGNGLIYGSVKLFAAQIGAILISAAVAAAATVILISLLKKFNGIRVSDMEEAQGIDITEHGERAYPAFDGLD